MNIMTYYIIYMTYEISLMIIYNCILNLVNKTGFQADSQSRLRSRLPPEPFVPLARLGSAQNGTEPSQKSRLESLNFELFPSLYNIHFLPFIVSLNASCISACNVWRTSMNFLKRIGVTESV